MTMPSDSWNGGIDDVLCRVTLRDWIEIIMSFESIWFNDEEEHWFIGAEDHSWPEDKRRLVSWTDEHGSIHERSIREHLNDRFAIKAGLRFNRSLRGLFKDGYPGRHEIAKLFGRSHYARTIPYYQVSHGL